VLIRESADGVLPGATVDDGIGGAVCNGTIHFFADRLRNRMNVQRTLFHELLHYGASAGSNFARRIHRANAQAVPAPAGMA
jgi:hypothetical protein